jgi:hypothetical protein
MANRSRIKSDKLRAVEIKFQQLQTREHEIEAQAAKNAKVRCELDTLKLEHTRDNCRGNTLSTALSLLATSGE